MEVVSELTFNSLHCQINKEKHSPEIKAAFSTVVFSKVCSMDVNKYFI